MNAAHTEPDPWHAPAEEVDAMLLDDAALQAPDEDGDEAGAAREPASDPAPACAADTASDAQLATLIEAVAERDERALTQLYDATVARVYGLVRRVVRNTALAEEVVEDTYFQVWRQAVRFDPERGRALTWLLAMARSRAVDAWRRESRFEHAPLDTTDAVEAAADDPPVDELLDLANHRADLHQALMILGAQPRQLVSMAFLRGLTHEEIAEQMQLPLGTVKSQIRRALLALREALGAHSLPMATS